MNRETRHALRNCIDLLKDIREDINGIVIDHVIAMIVRALVE